MKIGIMTFWESQDNYGQVLQGFALQEYLKRKGHDAYTIRFKRIPEQKKKSLWQRIVNFNLSKFIERRKQKYNLSNQPKSRGFDEFRSDYMTFSDETYNSLSELMNNPPKADAYITGSDQVWNNNFPVPCEPFLLGFGDEKVKRIAYAASFGTTALDEGTEKLFRKYLPKFDVIGVRETGGLNLCHQLGFYNAIWTPDPTMLFNKNEWVEALNLSAVDKSSKKKVFIYTLANSKIQDREKYMNYLKSLPDTEVKHVTANGDTEGNFFPGVREWVQEIRSSDFVLTNSFHGMVFCILFNKNFVVLPNTGKSVGMNDRVTSLLDGLSLSRNLSYSFNEFEFEKMIGIEIAWENVNKKIVDWRNDVKNILY